MLFYFLSMNKSLNMNVLVTEKGSTITSENGN